MPITEKNSDNTLEAFAGFEEESDIDFFGENPDEVEPLAPIEKPKDDADDTPPADPPADPPKDKKKTEQEIAEEEIEFFGVDTPPEDIAPVDDDDDTPPPATTTPIATLNYLKEKGLIEYELEGEQELTDELAEQLVEDNFDDRVETRVEELFAEVPDSVRSIMKYAIDGGDVNTLLTSMAQKATSPISEDMDMEDETNQLLVVVNNRVAEGDDKETAESYADYLKESGKLKAIAEKQHTAIISKQKATEKAQLKAVSDKKQQDKINQRKFKSELTTTVAAVENINGLPITKVDKRELPNYMADRTVKLEDGRQVTGMQRDLYLAMQDKDKSVMLAKLLKSDFNFDSIAKATKTKYTKEVKKNVTRSGTIKTENVTKKKKDLASYF